jgi:hypothetical protein
MEAGQLQLNPLKMPEALKTALAQGLIKQDEYDEAIKKAYLVQAAAHEDYNMRKAAGSYAGLKSVAAGAARGAVSLGAGLGTGAAVAAAAPESAFTSLALVPAAAMATGAAAGEVYDAALQSYAPGLDAARKLHPLGYAAGDLATMAVPAPIGMARAIAAARLVNESKGALAATKFLAKPFVAGATGTTAVQGMDKATDPEAKMSIPQIAIGGALGVAEAAAREGSLSKCHVSFRSDGEVIGCYGATLRAAAPASASSPAAPSLAHEPLHADEPLRHVPTSASASAAT